MRDILRSAGTTFIMVTHDAAEGELVDDRVVLMSDGRLIDA
ncbi:hypothetical protein [Demequina lutea]|nr:hypothetical protein [Demequina lutea]